MVTCQRPWKGLNHSQIIHALTTGKCLTLPPTTPTCIRKFVAKCLASKPEQRPTFTTIMAELEELDDELVGTVGELA
jgi:hypothetical protein